MNNYLSPSFKAIWLILLMHTCITYGFSQKSCGFDYIDYEIGKLDRAGIVDFQKYMDKKSYKAGSDPVSIPIQLHIMRYSDGSDVVSMDDIIEGIDHANSLFQNMDVTLEICNEPIYLNDSENLIYTPGDDHPLTRIEEVNPNALNIYYFESVLFPGFTGFVCGVGGQHVWMTAQCAAGATLAHEVGHHYGLPHTHGRYNSDLPDYTQEDPTTEGFPTPVYIEGAVRHFNEMSDDNNNNIFDCFETGDGICDTPAEAVRLGGALDWSTCIYSGNTVDYYGDLHLPLPGNVMSYGSCNEEHFTQGQYDRMRYIIDTRYLNEQCGCKNDDSEITVTTAESFGKGSFAWALSCATNKSNTVKITFDIPRTNLIEADANNFLLLSNRDIEIDGLNKATGEKITLSGFTFILRDNQKFIFRNINFEELLEDGFIFSIGNIAELEFHECGFYAVRNVFADGAANLIVKGCKFGEREDGTVTEFFSGISVINQVANFEIDSNIIQGCTGRAFNIDGYTSGDIRNNTMTNSNGQFLVASGASNFSIESNTILDNRAPVITLYQTEEVKIIGNIIDGGISTGLDIIECNSVELDSNKISNIIKSENGFGGTAIYVVDSENIGIGANAGNVFSDNEWTGCYLRKTSDIIFINNEVYKNGNNGCRFVDCSAIKIGNFSPDNRNDFYENKGRGLVLTTCNDFNFGVNNFSCNDNGGISISPEVVSKPSITSSLFNALEGEADRFQDIYIFKNNLNCDKCEAQEYIASVKSNGSGEWRFEGEALESDLGESFSVYTSDASFASNISKCIGGFYVAGCDSIVEEYPSIQSFDSYVIEDNKIAGNNIEIYRDQCSTQGDVFVYDGRRTSSTAYMYSDTYDLLNAETAQLAFDIAHASAYGNRQSRLQIDVSTDCGKSYSNILDEQTYDGLRTLSSPDRDNIYIPTSCDDYANREITLNDFLGQQVIFRFVFSVEEVWGPRIYIDNITVDRQVICVPQEVESEDFFISFADESIALCEGESYILDFESTAEEIRWTINGESVDNFDPSAPIDYSANIEGAITNDDKCTLLASMDIQVNEVPVFNLGDNITLCKGEVATYELVSVASEYTYFLNDIEISSSSEFNKVSISEAGTFKVVAATESGCEYTDSIKIEVIEVPTLELPNDSLACYGSNVVLAAKANTQKITWYQRDEIINVGVEVIIKEPGTYVAVAENTQGCTVADSVQVLFTEELIIEVIQDTTVCVGDIYKLELQEYGGTSYEWTLGDSTILSDSNTADLATPGMYTIELIDDNECSVQSSFELIAEEYPEISVGIEVEALCFGDTLGISFFSSVDEYEWTRNDESIQGVSSNYLEISEGGNYRLQAASPIGCSSSEEFNIIQSDSLSLPNINDLHICEDDDVPVIDLPKIDVTNQIFYSDSLLAENVDQFTLERAGVYTVRVLDNLGCQYSDQFVFNITDLPQLTIITSCDQENVYVAVDADVDNLQWSYNGAPIQPEDNTYFLNQGSGTYSLEAIGDNECAIVESIDLMIDDKIELQLDPIYNVCEGDTLELDAGVSSNDTITWTIGGEVLSTSSNLMITEGGEYVVTAKNENGCIFSSISTISISEIPTPEIIVSNLELCIGETTIASLLDTSLIYRWYKDDALVSQGGSFTILESGVYRVEEESSAGCIGVDEITITEIVLPDVDLGEDKILCRGSDTRIGLASIDGNEYQWSRDGEVIDDAEPMITVDEAGTYQLRVTSDAGCFSIDEVTIQVVEGPQIDVDETVYLCPGTEAVISVETTASALMWLYEGIELNETSETLSVTQAGVYTVQGAGNNGCIIEKNVEVIYNAAPLIEVDSIYFACGDEDVRIEVGNDIYDSYAWIYNGEMIPEESDVLITDAEGAYRLIATTADGCDLTQDIVVNKAPLPEVALDSDTYTLCGGSSIQLVADGNADQYYVRRGRSIIMAESPATFELDASGAYHLVGLDDNTCRDSIQFLIEEVEPTSVNLDVSYELCADEEVILDPGNFDEYLWSTDETSSTLTITNDGSHEEVESFTFAGVDRNGCLVNATFEVAFYEISSVRIEALDSILCLGESTELIVQGGESIYWPEFDSEDRMISVTPMESKEYEVEVVDNCTERQVTRSIALEVRDGSEVMTSGDTCTVEGEAIVLQVFGENNNVMWQDHTSIMSALSSSEITVTPNKDQVYSVRVEDDQGCTVDRSIQVCVNDIFDFFNPPNVLVPGNGDDKNEDLIFANLEKYGPSELQIFDKWGKVVYESRNYQSEEQPFNGTTRGGHELSSGTYFYILQIGGFTKPIKSSLTILR